MKAWLRFSLLLGRFLLRRSLTSIFHGSFKRMLFPCRVSRLNKQKKPLMLPGIALSFFQLSYHLHRNKMFYRCFLCVVLLVAIFLCAIFMHYCQECMFWTKMCYWLTPDRTWFAFATNWYSLHVVLAFCVFKFYFIHTGP